MRVNREAMKPGVSTTRPRIIVGIILGLAALGFDSSRGDDPVGSKTEPAHRRSLTAARFARAPVIDGDAADWPSDLPRAVMALDPDAEDFRGSVRAGWDSEYLYLLYEVASGKEMRNAGNDPATAFKTGDTVEMFLSVASDPLASRTPRGPNSDTAQPGDYRVLMTVLRNEHPVVFGYDFVNPDHREHPMVFQVTGPKTTVDHAAEVPGATMAVRKAIVDGVHGFIVEAKVPWDYFRNFKPRAGAKLPFNLAINFSNEAGNTTMGKAYWSGPSHMVQDLGIEAQIHPESWGWLELGNGGP